MSVTTSPEEVSARAEQIYRDRIALNLVPEDDGKFVVVDVDTGAYEVDADEIAAMRRARAVHPDGTLHLMRVGSRTAGRIGARMQPADR